MPPVGAESGSEVADSVVVEDVFEGEKEKALFVGVDGHLFVGGFDVQAGPEEGAMWVGGLGGKADIGGCGKGDSFGEVASWVDVTDGAVQHKARVASFRVHDVELTDGDALGPVLLGLLRRELGADYPSLLDRAL